MISKELQFIIDYNWKRDKNFLWSLGAWLVIEASLLWTLLR
jgi:hypothetical protein